MTLPWQGTTPEISSEADSRYETPGGAQNKVNVSQEYLLHLLKLAVTGLSNGSEAAIARYSEPYDITYDWLKDRLDAADSRDIAMNDRLDKTTVVTNVLAYGAVSGGEDSTTAFKNAILAAGSYGVVYVPAGNYKVRDTLLIDVNLITIKGDGEQSVIEGFTDNKDMIKVTSAYKVKIENLFLFNKSTTSSKTVNFSFGEAHILESCSIQNVSGNTADIVYYQGSNVKIKNNGISNYDSNSYCIHTRAETAQININTDIIGNYMGGVGSAILIDAVDNLRRPEGIKINQNTILTTGSEQITIHSAYYVDISHNIIDVATNYNIRINAEKSGIDGITIDNNYFGNNAPFGRVVGMDESAVGILNITISKNYFSSGGYAVFGGNNLDGIIIESNILNQTQQTSFTLDSSKNCIIVSNREKTVSFSLYLVDGSNGGPFVVSSNIFKGNMVINKTNEQNFKVSNNVGLDA